MKKFPRWIRQITNRSDQHADRLVLECPQQYTALYEDFLNASHIHYEFDPHAQSVTVSRLIIPFPANDACESWEEMVEAFMYRFQEFLHEQYGDHNPLSDN